MVRFALISTSVTPQSSSRRFVSLVARALASGGAHTEVLDLKTLPPLWMQEAVLETPPHALVPWLNTVTAATGVVFFVPVYGFAAASTAKFVAEALGPALAGKPIMIVTTAGSEKSYLAVRDLMSSLAFDQKAYCYPRILFDAGGVTSPISLEAHTRCRELCDDFAAFARALDDLAAQQAKARVVNQ